MTCNSETSYDEIKFGFCVFTAFIVLLPFAICACEHLSFLTFSLLFSSSIPSPLFLSYSSFNLYSPIFSKLFWSFLKNSKILFYTKFVFITSKINYGISFCIRAKIGPKVFSKSFFKFFDHGFYSSYFFFSNFYEIWWGSLSCTNWYLVFSYSYFKKIPYCYFSSFLVSYDDTTIESKYIKSGMLTMQDEYKEEIVFVVVDIERCDIILRQPWCEAKNCFSSRGRE